VNFPSISRQGAKALRALHWLPAYAWQRTLRRPAPLGSTHVILAVADHFEPSFLPARPADYASADEQERRLERWCRAYPAAMAAFRDADGFPFRHTYFFPAEQWEPAIIDRLVAHCHAGGGEIEIHLHHGVRQPDTAANARRVLLDFRDHLWGRGCLSLWNGDPRPRYAFVHGNWALANSAGGRFCGVDDELQILADTGCYADFTLPSAPDGSQVATINSLYECAGPLRRRAPQRRARHLRVGRPPRTLPLIIQGPLGLAPRPPGRGWPPRIENGELTVRNPPTLRRFQLWVRASIGVRGRPTWSFVKLHCHGMDPRDEETLLGSPMRAFLTDLAGWARSTGAKIHFVTAREMTNIALAACDGRDGDPGAYRDYRLRATRQVRPDPAPARSSA
jgi:hypothetical protein